MYIWKRSQVGIFILLFIIIIIVGIYIFNFDFSDSNSTQEIELSDDKELLSLKDYAQSCIEQSALYAVYLLAYQGGFIYEYNDSLDSMSYQVAYHQRNGLDTSPSKEFMEKELSQFVALSSYYCVQDFALEGYNLSVDNASVDATIYESKIIYDLDFPMTLKKVNSTFSLNEFYYSQDIRLGHLLNEKFKILQDYNTHGEVRLDLLSQKNTNVSYGFYNAETLFFSLEDHFLSQEESLVFNFALQRPTYSTPRIDFIPDFVTTVNEGFNYTLYGSDWIMPNITYWVNSTNLKLDTQSGNFIFPPSSTLGITHYEACVFNEVQNKDCMTFSVEVKDEI